MTDIRTSERADIEITSLAYGGDGVGRIGDKVVFVSGAAPGDRLRVRVVENRKSFCRAVPEEILEPSPVRVEPFCPHVERCGGCQWQHIDYTAQCDWKRTIVDETFKRIGGLSSVDVEPCMPSPSDRAYRTTARYPVRHAGDSLIIGYNENRSHRVVDIDRCPVAVEGVNHLAARTRAVLASSPEKGLVDEITVRSSHNHPSRLLTVSTRKPCDLGGPARDLLASVDGLAGVVHRFPDNPHPRIYGEGHRFETVSGITLKVRDRSFFQTNTPQTERLAGLVADLLQAGPGDVVVDGFGGVGLFSLLAAPRDAVIHLYDLSGNAVKDADENAAAHGFTSFTAHLADTAQAAGAIGEADRLILDPPRTGMETEAVGAVLALKAERIVHVSCNPSTLARDLALFVEGGRYELERVVPVDMFPHTFHIETAAVLRKT